MHLSLSDYRHDQKDAPNAGPDSFLGDWSVSRTVVDFGTGQTSTFVGVAAIDTTGFAEHGEVRIGERKLPASRRYRLDLRDDAATVFFQGGAEFIWLDLRAVQSVYHRCGDDDYRGRFFFAGTGSWVEAWRVKGPRKSYASLTRFRRLSGLKAMDIL